MAYEDRVKIIQELQRLRGSQVMTLFLSDRRISPAISIPALNTRLGTEQQLPLYDQLRTMGRVDKLDLFLYTRGGETDSVWPLVSLFREFAGQQFSVLVPFRAHSAGTMICLGADEIVMGEAAELSPIDPTTGNQFNPQDEIEHGKRKGISVEDVTSYMELARDESKVGIKDPNHILEVFKKLSDEVHPLALGNVNRVHNQIRKLAAKLLALHMDEDKKDQINDIVNQFTVEFYSHTQAISRREARDILGSEIAKYATDDEQTLMWSLFEEYADVFKLRRTFNLREFIGDEIEKTATFNGAFIDSDQKSYVFRSLCMIRQRSDIPSNIQIQVQPGQSVPPLIPGFPSVFSIEPLFIGWEENEEGV
jgi:hypothetical protein